MSSQNTPPDGTGQTSPYGTFQDLPTINLPTDDNVGPLPDFLPDQRKISMASMDSNCSFTADERKVSVATLDSSKPNYFFRKQPSEGSQQLEEDRLRRNKLKSLRNLVDCAFGKSKIVRSWFMSTFEGKVGINIGKLTIKLLHNCSGNSF